MAYMPKMREHTAGTPFDPDVENANFAAIKSWIEGANIDNQNLRTNTFRIQVPVSRLTVGTGAADETVVMWYGQFPVKIRCQELQAYPAVFNVGAGSFRYRIMVYLGSAWYTLGAGVIGTQATFGSIAIAKDIPADTPVKMEVFTSGGDACDYEDVTVTGIFSQQLQEP
jgi:hypothetical protein